MRAFLVLSVLASLFCHAIAHADVVPCGPSVPPEVICLSGDVSDVGGGGPLVAGKIYHMGGFVRVPPGETLTVEDGAILKFASLGDLLVQGTLSCGAAVITSQKDDTAGGDTNGDGPSLGTEGDWNGLAFQSGAGASSLAMTTVRYAKVGIGLFGADITMDTVTITQCSGTALDLKGNSFPVVTNCTFSLNDFAVSGVPLEAIPGFLGNGALLNTQGDYMLVTSTTMTNNLTIGPNNSLGSEPFVSCTTIDVPGGLTLTTQPGTTFKFGSGPVPVVPGCSLTGLTVNGTLIADGLTLTSLLDDTVAGDTNKDMSMTLPAPCDWGQVLFQPASDGSVVSNTIVRYGGKAPFVTCQASIDLNSADVTLDTVTVEFGPNTALRLNGNSFPTVDNCTFSNHAGVAVDRVRLQAVAGFTNNSASMNALGDYMELLTTGAELLTTDATILQQNSMNSDGLFVVAGDITVEPGATLTLGAGVVFKWTTPDNHLLTVKGTLAADAAGGPPITFTSLPDDAVLGDSNKDGGLTQPAPGDWVGLRFTAGSDASVLDNAIVRYGGQKELAFGAVQVQASDPPINAVVVERSETAGLTLMSGSFSAVTNCTFRENDLAVTGVPIVAVPGFDNNTAVDNTRGDYLEITEGDVSLGAGPSPGGVVVTIGPASALLPSGVFLVSTDIDVPAGFLLEMLAGTIIKWDGQHELDVAGCVHLGSLGGTVVLTSCNDDSIGGDTKKDGFTEGTPGDWDGIDVTADGSIFDDVLVRFGGGIGPVFELDDVTAQLQDVTVEDCADTALDLFNDSIPVVDGCSFDRNVFAVDRVPIRALPGFSDNTATDNTLGDYQRVTEGIVPFDLHIQPSQSLNNGPIVFGDSIDVLTGTTLTLDPNVTFKFGSTFEVDVDGTLICLGAGSPVIFTTLFDDIAGDTNKDGSFTVPGPGAWRGLTFADTSDASVITGARVRFAGFAGVPTFDLSFADIIVTDTLIESSAGVGMDLNRNSFPQVRRTSFVDGLGIPVDEVPTAAVPGFTDNTATGNALGDYLRVSTSTISDDVIIAHYNALNSDGVFVLNGGQTVGATATLDLLQGTIFKWTGSFATLVVGGSLNARGTGLEPVVFTSIHDDTVGGDTTKNGTATVPAPGDWGRFTFSSSAGPSTLENLTVRYGGAETILIQNNSTGARAIRADFAAGDGIRATGLTGDAIDWVAFGCNGDGIDLLSGVFDVIHPTVASNGGFGIRQASSHAGMLWNANVFGNSAGETTGFVAGEVFFSNVGAGLAGVDGNISADPLFTDPVTGDLTLGTGSPCIDAADFTTALNTVTDHVEAPRILDHDLDGAALADMGAFEKAAYTLSFGGQPKLATVMSFQVDGATPGTAFFALGLLDGTTFIPPYGFTLFGTLGTQIFLGVAPTGQPIFLMIPDSLPIVGTEFGVQGLGRPIGLPSVGNATNRYSGMVFP